MQKQRQMQQQLQMQQQRQMQRQQQGRMHKSLLTLFMSFVTVGLCPLSFAQESQAPRSEGERALVYTPEHLTRARDHAARTDVTGFDLEVLRHAHDKTALPSLEKSFLAQNDELMKLKVASVLVHLGEADPQYWEYLVSSAERAVTSDAPDPTAVGPDGNPDPANTPSEAFSRWSANHGKSAASSRELVQIQFPAAVSQLADTEDVRAIPVLRRGLASSVYIIQVEAAVGLAGLHDQTSINQIIALCKKDPPEVSRAIAAGSLIFFDDAGAQAAVKQYLSNDYREILLRARKNGRGPLR